MGAGATTGIAISHRPSDSEGWLELLSSGLTFDLAGLAPEQAAPMPRVSQYLGLPENLAAFDFEALVLRPGPHLAGAGSMMPVVRVMLAVAAQLAETFGARGICWHPAETCMEAGYFSRVVEDWLFGGAFPGLGLTAIQERADGSLVSSGLSFFIGQEVAVPNLRGEPTSEAVKLAVRAIDYLVNEGPLREFQHLDVPDGGSVTAEPSGDGSLVLIRRAG